MGPCGFVLCQQRVYHQCRVDVGSHIIGCGCNGQGLAVLMVAVVVPLELVCICHQYVWQAVVGVRAAAVFSGRFKGSPSDPGENSDVHVLDVDGTECPSNAPINRCSRR